MRTGITGATGQLGRIVIDLLKEIIPNENIVALARSPEKASQMGVEVRKFDYNKPEPDALSGINNLLLISGSEIGERARQHSNVIRASVEAGVGWIVYTSILHADTSSISLAREHFETEKEIQASGITNSILRNGWYTENYTGSVQNILATGVLPGSAGDGKISSALRSDYAEAAVAVLTGEGYKGKIFELAGDEAYTLNELAAEISRQTGKDIQYRNLPESEYANVLKSFGIPENIAWEIAGWDVSASRGDLYDDSRQLSKLTGHPTGSLTKAVEQALKQAQFSHTTA